MKKRTTIDDVAREVGVSRQTVSRAINGMDGISPNTRDRVMEMVSEMGYQPSRLARGMAGNSTQTIGLIIGNITNPSHAEIFQCLYNLADAEHYNVLLRNTNYRKELELKAVKSLIAENIDGLVILSPTLDSEELAQFSDEDCPIVVIHRAISAKNISSIVTDTSRATKSVVEYLMGSGHECIGLVTRIGELKTIRHFKGYQQAVEMRGLPNCPSLIEQEEITMRGGYLATLRLLKQNPNLTAITTYNDLMAIGALKACEELERHVPDSVAIFGYNDIPFASFCTPTLSTIRINGEEVGKRAFQRIKEMIARPEIEFPPAVLDIDLVIRESTNRQ